MDLLIPNNWLKKYLDTKAKPAEIAKYLSLCGPSIERVKKLEDGDSLYSIEVTSNRVDSASVLGIAREAATILPQFKIAAKLITNNQSPTIKYKLTKKVKYLDVRLDSKLCSRFTAVLIKNVVVEDSSKEIKDLLVKVGVRPINNIVDISNLVMHEIGQPVHTFDYDKIVGHKMYLRESKKGESVTTLDEKEFNLDGGDIVIEDETGNLIDLCGIMGGSLSAINNSPAGGTKNVLLFVQNYDKHHIRKTSMKLGIRSEAAVLFEKGLDSENVINGLNLCLSYFGKMRKVVIEKEVLDLYPNPYKPKKVITTLDRLEQIIGINLDKKQVEKILTSLGFMVKRSSRRLEVTVPSYRAEDIDIPEDIAEEVARIYGYHNMPSIIMDGKLPHKVDDSSFEIEEKIKNKLKELKFIEIYNLSLVPQNYVDIKKAVKLKNPLGPDTEYLRTNLRNGLINSIKENSFDSGTLKLFELSNVYAKRDGNLPNETLKLSGIIKNQKFIDSKTDVYDLLQELNINFNERIIDGSGFKAGQRIVVFSKNKEIGEYGNLENGMTGFEFDVEKLLNADRIVTKYKEVSKYPSQVEDMTLTVPERTYTGDLINSIKSLSQLVNKVELTDVFKQNYTFRIEYHSDKKTLTNDEVKEVREKIISKLSSKFGTTAV